MSFPEQLSYLSAQIMPRFLYLPILMHVPISPISPMKYTHFQNINARHTHAQVLPTVYLSVQTNNFLLMRKAIVIHLSVDLLFLSFFRDSPTCWNKWNPSLVLHNVESTSIPALSISLLSLKTFARRNTEYTTLQRYPRNTTTTSF